MCKEESAKNRASYNKFKQVVDDPSVLDELDISDIERSILTESINKKLTPNKMKNRADVRLRSFDDKCIDVVKRALTAGLQCSTKEYNKINLVALVVYVVTT